MTSYQAMVMQAAAEQLAGMVVGLAAHLPSDQARLEVVRRVSGITEMVHSMVEQYLSDGSEDGSEEEDDKQEGGRSGETKVYTQPHGVYEGDMEEGDEEDSLSGPPCTS